MFMHPTDVVGMVHKIFIGLSSTLLLTVSHEINWIWSS